MKYSRRNSRTKYNKTRKCKKGGLGTFFPRPPKNNEEEIKMQTDDIGRVKLNRLEKSLKMEFDDLKRLRKYCMMGCKIESCMYKNNENCMKMRELLKKKNDVYVGEYCKKRFKNITCRNYVSKYNKIKFYLNYISNLNQNCQDLLNEFKIESQQLNY